MTKIPVKKWIAVILSLLLTGTAAITAYAFLGAKPQEQINTIRIGEQLETVQETFETSEIQTVTDTIRKVVNVKNNGSVPCFVRVFMELSDNRLNSGKVLLSADGSQFQTVEDFKKTPPAGWTYAADRNNALDGYFYYTEPLAAGAETPPLLTVVRTDFGDIYDLTDFDIIIYSESVQTIEIDESGTEYTEWEKAWKSFLRISESETSQ